MVKKITLLLVFIFLLVCLYIFIGKVYNFSKTYIYPLDDAYIHLSIAKNFAQKNVWGITSHGFSSTTSSPFFTLLLAICIKVFGNYQFIPIVLNIIISIFLIIILHKNLKKESNILYGIIISGVVILMPLHTMILLGMEHVIHTLCLLMCMLYFTQYWMTNDNKNYVLTIFFAFLAVGFRYESLFFIIFMCIGLFFIKRQVSKSILLGLISISPVVVYGLISISQGSFFLPNSLILKGNLENGLLLFIYRIIGNIKRAAPVLLFAILLIIYLLKQLRNKELLEKNIFQIITFLGLILQLMFANFGWLLRYEAYLIPLLLLSLVPLVKDFFNNKRIVGIIFFSVFIIINFFSRFYSMMIYEVTASHNIYEQQIQIAKFLQKYYNDKKIVVNDIGAVTYFTNIEILDTYGLGTVDVAKIRKNDHGEINKNNRELIDYIKEKTIKDNYDIAIVYDNWFVMPNNFKKIGSWKIFDNYVCGGSKVNFYQINKNANLKKNFEEFSKKLPAGVKAEMIQ